MPPQLFFFIKNFDGKILDFGQHSLKDKQRSELKTNKADAKEQANVYPPKIDKQSHQRNSLMPKIVGAPESQTLSIEILPKCIKS